MNRTSSTVVVLCAILLLTAPDFCWSTEVDNIKSEQLFVRRIVPLMREKCLGCHGADREMIEGNLDLTSLSATLKGGDSESPGLKPGEPDASPIYLAALRTHEEWSAMPPKEAEQLSEQQLSWLREWISSGASWPDDAKQAEIAEANSKAWSVEDGIPIASSGGLSEDWTNRRYDPESLWAYQPLSVPEELAEYDPSVAVIDRFISAKAPQGLFFAPRADRPTLLRRATFDLIGLPPTPAEIREFVDDRTDDDTAFKKVIDRLLASPHYGERMAQHWLDVTRYADSSGLANDYERGNAWRYRDYVIRAFNEDKPYDQFVREQIAGDELAPDNPEMLVAVGFLRMGPWELTGMEVAKVARQRFLDDVTNNVGEVFLGHSLQCARCHDHKFDPVPTRDYYSIQAVFATTQLTERKAAFLPSENCEGFEERKYLEQRRVEYEQNLVELDEAMLANAQLWYKEQNRSPDQWNEVVNRLKNSPGEGVFNKARNEMKRQGLSEDEYPPKLVGFTPQQFGLERVSRKGVERLSWEFDRYQPYALSVYNGKTLEMNSVKSPLRMPKDPMKSGELEETCILVGGDPFSLGAPVEPGYLSVLADQVDVQIPQTVSGRRTAFAEWITDPENPLTSRVIVNRIWQWHFGRGLAGNPNNFGSTGKRPTHPGLLDWLATALIKDGYSIKQLHRRIMLSDAYRRSSTHPLPNEIQELDPLGTSYAVFTPRRLTAEELRDAMLLLSGELNPKLGGIPCRPEINQEVALQPRQVMGTFAAAWTPNPLPEQRNRRSIYALKLRGLSDPMMDVFNSPSPDFSCERRDASTVTPQAFSLFNGQNTHSRALAMAARVLKNSKDDVAAITLCFQQVYGRDPSASETSSCLNHFDQLQKMITGNKPNTRQIPL
ncbi:MAG: PSD1 domain-containing protein, partial [Planctomycetaceae bacterium]|nr:PSD1 domain-containing protein [Planctomycetaceae bacterium]